MPIVFGLPDEWRDFERRHRDFFATVLPPLMEAATRVFARTVETTQPHERVGFMLGRHVPEDFSEIMVLSTNGYGIGALKLLRSMYERVVVMTYLLRHPEKAEDFNDWHLMDKQKFVNHLIDDGDDPSTYLSQDALAEIRDAAPRLKSRFGERRSWTDLDLKSMARAVGLGAFYTVFYYWPTLHTHPTATGMAARIDITAESASFKIGPQREEADRALMGAHCCLLLALNEHVRHFTLGVDMAARSADYQKYWDGRLTSPALDR